MFKGTRSGIPQLARLCLTAYRPTHWARIPAITLLLMLSHVLLGCSDNHDSQTAVATPPMDPNYPDYTLVQLSPGPDLEQQAQQALIDAKPRTVVELPAGTFDFTKELSVSVDNVVLRGQGMRADGGTVLSFASQTTGGQSILATGNNFIIEDLAVEDSPADGIKVEGTNGVTIRRVRMEWTNGADESNGAYGFYPVQTRNVLIEDSEVRGASDAGVYVGQSEVIIVRRNLVYENVAGIEIENSKFADVYENETRGNTGGILVFDLPGPPIQGGEATRVFNNTIVDNNEPNFAPAGNIVGVVPAGTGLMIMANDDIEAFDNTITGNQSAGVIIVSYYINDPQISKPTYDPIPEKIYIHDNVISDNGDNPQGQAAAIAALVFDGQGFSVDVFYDSSGNATDLGLLLEYPDGFNEDQAICVVNNTPGITLGQANAAALLTNNIAEARISTDASFFDCTHASLPEVVLEPPVDPSNPGGGNDDQTALCAEEGEGRNVDAFVADCPNLSDYRLFEDPAEPRSAANDGIIYDLNTPLFTDYTSKYRFVFVPEDTQAAYRDEAVFDFPVGTIIAKTFTIAQDLRIADSAEELLETRLLIRRQDGWKALPYVWNDDQSDAQLSVTGGGKTIHWIDAQGESQSTDYVIPNTNNCANCHGEDTLLPIGPTARSLNGRYRYVNGEENQLTHWSQAGVLAGVPTDLASIPTIPKWGDTSAALDDRARGYLDTNCAHCHAPTAAASTSGLYLDFFRPFSTEVGLCKPPVAAGIGSGGLSYAIVPGDAENSILHYRMNSNATNVRMPELGRSVIHTEGVALIQQWIDAMSAENCAAP